MIPKSESQKVKFILVQKETVKGSDLEKTLIAFANSLGGDLYIGVGDRGEIIGVESPEQVEERLISIVDNTISPSLKNLITTDRMIVDGKVIIKVHVNRGNSRPYCLNPFDSGIFVRIGTTTCPASIDEIARIVCDSNPIPYEERISIEQNLTFNYFLRFCAERGLDIDLKNNLALGFWNNKLQAYTNLAFICSDQSDCAVVMICFADNEKNVIVDSKRVKGSIFLLFEEIISFVSKSNHALNQFARVNECKENDLENSRNFLHDTMNLLLCKDFSNKTASLVHVIPDSVQMTIVGKLMNVDGKENKDEETVDGCCNTNLLTLFKELKLTDK